MSRHQPDVWVSVSDATQLVSRAERTVYSWIDKGYLTSRRGANGLLQVRGADVLQVEATRRTGRPRGTARPGGYTTRHTEVLDESMQRGQDGPRQSRTAPGRPER